MAARKISSKDTTRTTTTETLGPTPRITTTSTTIDDNVVTMAAPSVFHNYRARIAAGAPKPTEFNPAKEGGEGILLTYNLTIPQPKNIWQKYVAWSVLGGLIPIPFVDIGAIAVTNYFMVKNIAAYYNQDFDSTKTKAIIASVIAGILPQSLTAGIPGAMVRMIPMVGPLVSFLIEPGFAALVTYVVAKLAIQGYESAGDLGSVDHDYVLSQIQQVYELGWNSGWDKAVKGFHSHPPGLAIA